MEADLSIAERVFIAIGMVTERKGRRLGSKEGAPPCRCYSDSLFTLYDEEGDRLYGGPTERQVVLREPDEAGHSFRLAFAAAKPTGKPVYCCKPGPWVEHLFGLVQAVGGDQMAQMDRWQKIVGEAG